MSKRDNAPGPKPGLIPSPRPSALSLAPARSGRIQRQCSCGGGASGCQTCSEPKRKLLRAARAEARSGPAAAPPIVDEVLSSPGQPLDSSTRTQMETRFGHDFGHVRVHTDGKAATSARDVEALAYTVGNHIVFDQGQYSPGSSHGQRLLAHELAHTLQQRGAAHTGPLTYDSPGESALEQEADAAATAVMAMSSPHAPAAPSIEQRPPTATLARQARSWKAIEPSRSLDTQDKVSGANWNHLVTGMYPEVPADGSPVPSTVAFRIEPLHLLPAKGPVVAQYQKIIDAQALEATISFEGKSPKAGLKQARDDTPDLRDSWLRKVGWEATAKNEKWKAAGGGSEFPVLEDGVQCQMDHIVELQLGGTNIEQNIIPLDAKANGDSGRSVWWQLEALAQSLRGSDLFPEGDKPSEIILHFTQVKQAPQIEPLKPKPGRADSCLQVDANVSRPLVVTSPDGFTPYEVSAGGASTVFDVKPPPASTSFEGSTPRNQAARQLIPGLLLTTLNRATTANGFDKMHAQLDERRKTRLPIDLHPPKGSKQDITFNVKTGAKAGSEAGDPATSAGAARWLELSSKSLPKLTFTYPYLSEGTLQPELSPDLKLTAKGTLTPSLALLNKVPIEVSADFEKEEFSGKVKFPADKLTPPIKGLRFTKSELGVELAPQLSALGALAFEMGPSGKPWLDGAMTATADTTHGLVVTGTMNAHLPGVDKAEGTVEYADHRWKGQVEIASKQIGLPYVKDGSLVLAISTEEKATSLAASGSITLQPPGFDPIILSARREDDHWTYKGKGSLKVPGLNEPVELALTHDGSTLSGTGKVSVSRGGLKGLLHVHYDSQKGISGDAALSLKNDKLHASINANLGEDGKLSGEGSLTYLFAPNMEGNASVEWTEDHLLKLKGGIAFPKPIPLFAAKSNSYTLFSRHLDIPILGLSVGSFSIGLIARIGGGLEADYAIGPGTLQKVSATTSAQLNLADPSKLSFNSVNLEGTLVIPASAGLSLSVRGGLGISAGIGSITGGLTATGSARLAGGLTTHASATYKQNRFILDVTPSIKAALELSLGLSADVTAEALGFEKKWVWRLAKYTWNSGLIFGLTAPIHYDSAGSFTLPSPGQIQWIVPDVNVRQLVSSLINRVKG